MAKLKDIIHRWGPAVLWAAAIFFASATPATHLPSFGSLDYVFKKTGHAVAYALLGLLIRRALGARGTRNLGAWLIAVCYALVDEFHQIFVPGRHPSLVDALLFDGGGAGAALWLSTVIPSLTARLLGRSDAKPG